MIFFGGGRLNSYSLLGLSVKSTNTTTNRMDNAVKACIKLTVNKSIYLN